jgi:Right handed beta helix region
VGAGGNHTGFFVTRRYVRFVDLDMSGFTERAIRCMYGTRITGGRYHHNGVNGFGCGLGRSSGGGVVVDGVEVDHNGSVAMLGHSSSGIKLAGSPGSVIRNSYVHDNLGNGIWFDVDSGGDQLDVAENNVVIGNYLRGIFYEVSRGPVVIRGNVVTGNNTSGTPGAAGIGVSSSKNVTIEGNILDGNRVWAIRANEIGRGYALSSVLFRNNVLNGGSLFGCDHVGVQCTANG